MVRDNNSINNDEVSLKEVMLEITTWRKYLRSKWLTIIIAGAIGGGLGLTYALLKKPVYKAELSFALEDDKSSGGLGAAMGLASQFGVDLGGGSGGGAFNGDNLLELMKSRSMVEKTLLASVTINGKEQTLAELYIQFNHYRDIWKNNTRLNRIQYLPNADRSKFTLQQDSVLGTFYKNITKTILSVDKIDKKLSIITIQVVSKNELFSKYFTETLAKTVSDFYINTKVGKSIENVNVLQKQTDSVRKELNAAITGVAASADNNPNANPALQILRVPSQHRQVDVQADQAILNQLVANLEISKVTLRKETPLIQVIDRPILPLDVQRISKLNGLIMGGVISMFLMSVLLLFRKFFKDIISNS